MAFTLPKTSYLHVVSVAGPLENSVSIVSW